MNLECLRALVALDDGGSMLRASELHGPARSTLRRRVEALERAAGVPLFEREGERRELTPAGQWMATEARAILHEAAVLLTATTASGTTASGELRVLAPVGLPPHLIGLLFAMLRPEFPDLAVRVAVSGDPVSEDLESVDLAFHFGPSTPRGQWITTVVFRARERLIASRAYLDAFGTPRTLDELAGHTLLSWEGPGEDATIWTTLSGRTLSMKLALSSPDIHLIRQCVVGGMGIARVPDGDVGDPGVDPDQIVVLFPDEFGRDLALRALVPEGLAQLPKIRLTLQFLRSFLSGL